MPNQKTLTAAKGALFGTLLMFNPSFQAFADEINYQEKIDTFMADLKTDLDVVPGYSIAVVRGDEILLATGYGITDVSSKSQVSADTLFYIASSTKSFTGLAVASLAQKSLLELDIPIKNYLAELEGSPAGEVTLIQLLSHTHGLEEEALTWRTAFTGDHNPEKLMEIVKNMPLSETPDAFNYQNTGYVIASMVMERVTGKSWKTVVEEQVLGPLGMAGTTAYVSKLPETGVALPHTWFGSSIQFPLVKIDSTMHAAGGHFSTANDMAIWLEAQLNDGLVDGKQIFPEGLVEGTHQARTSLEATFAAYKRHHYGFGWYQADYRDQQMIHHFGSFSGYRSHVSFIPALGMGVAVMINDTSRPGFNLPDTIANYIYDLAIDGENAGEAQRQEISGIAEMVAPMIGRTMPERPRNAPENEARYAGTYHNDEMGTLSFAMENDELVLTFGALSSKTTYKEDGSIRMELEPGRGTLGVFVEGENGTITAFRYRGFNYERQ
ncbi:MAG: serine hydrolase domain-containing protein [Sphingomonadales bacterium]